MTETNAAFNTNNNDTSAANDKSTWEEVTSVIKARFTELTNEDLQKLKGRADRLVNLVQERYSVSLEDAKRQVSEFEQTLEDKAAEIYQSASESVSSRYYRAKAGVTEFADEVRTFGIGPTAANVVRNYPATTVVTAFVLGALIAGTTVRTRRRRWY